jgi:hypothetical protein
MEARPTFQSHWATSMCFCCGDTDLGTKSVSEPVRKPGAGVDECACTVDGSTESFCGALRLGDDGVRMPGRMCVDVQYGVRQTRDGGDCKGKVEELGIVIGGNGSRDPRDESRVGGDVGIRQEGGTRRGITPQRYTSGEQCHRDRWPQCREHRLMKKQGLYCVARSRIVCLAWSSSLACGKV